ncbi:8972_t:CDS:2 [Funneliformis geosporum]|nr:8972_t:CDS:2 [Funneliformis geosporum]
MAFTKSSMLFLFTLFISSSFIDALPLFKRDQCPIGIYQGTLLYIYPSELFIPQGIIVPVGNKYKFSLYGFGVQMYKCNSVSRTWDFVGPEANIYNKKVLKDPEDASDYLVGNHFFQKEPVNGGRVTWESTIDCDDSSLISNLLTQIPSPDGPKNLPWLLLIATAHNGDGVFSDVTFTIRINTKQGIAPPVDECK